jgi:SAM-dependent methyltransferase
MTESPEPNFDRIAAIYRWAEYATLGPILERVRTHLLPHLGDPRRALVLGDGDGRFLEQLLRRYPDCDALAVDTSAAMLQRLTRRCRHVPHPVRIRTLHASALTIDPPPGADLVVTHFLLDCFTQPQVDALATRLSAQLAPGALWLLSDFALPSNPLLRPLARLYITALYTAFRLLTGLRVRQLPDPQSALLRAGFRRSIRRSFLGGLLYTELWQRE